MPRTVFNKYVHTKELLEELEEELGPTHVGEKFDVTYMTYTRWKKKASSFTMLNTNRNEIFENINDNYYYIYIIKTASDRLYVGFSGDLINRMQVHDINRDNLYNNNDFPLNIIHFEEFLDRKQALYREKEWIEYHATFNPNKLINNLNNHNKRNNKRNNRITGISETTSPIPQRRRDDTRARDITPEKTEYQKFYEYMKNMGEANPDHPVYSVWLKSADSDRRRRVLENTITEFVKFKGMST